MQTEVTHNTKINTSKMITVKYFIFIFHICTCSHYVLLSFVHCSKLFTTTKVNVQWGSRCRNDTPLTVL